MPIKAPILPANGTNFARTNIQTIAQRAAILTELLPDIRKIAEICCGDCQVQAQVYATSLDLEAYRGLDLYPDIVKANQDRGIDCVLGDALDPSVMRQFLAFDVIFFGPPLSMDCDGHQLLSFDKVRPGYGEFTRLLLDELGYQETLICICPRSTDAGNIQKLYHQIKTGHPEWGLRLIHHSYATVTGRGETTPRRLKYVELWFSSHLPDLWELRENYSIG